MILTTTPISSADKVKIDVSRLFGQRNSVRIRVLVEPSSKNRHLVVAAESASDGLSSTYEQLDGEHAPYARWIEWPLAPDTWAITAALYDEHNIELSRAQVTIELER